LIELKQYNSTNRDYQLSIKLLSKLKLSKDIEKAQRERLFIEEISKRVIKSETVLYVLQESDEIFGLIALSVSSIDTFPSLQIDYLFVSEPYRGIYLNRLDNTKISTYLIEFAINIAKRVQEDVGLRYVVLLPDNDKLQLTYKKMGFQLLQQSKWMFIKV